jgi:hypothetical protein
VAVQSLKCDNGISSHAFIYKYLLGGLEDGCKWGMDKRSNKTFEFQLDTEKGVLCLSDLLINTMVYLYNDNGYLQVKELCISSSLTLELPKRGTYVLVILHPASEVVVRRIIY